MRCVYCAAKAGILKRVCPTCASVVTLVEESAGRLGWTGLVDQFADAGLTQFQVDRVLDAEIEGRPALRDRLTSEMANVLMRGLGMPGRQSPEDVQRIRREGSATSEG
jgi:hypothetical protein